MNFVLQPPDRVLHFGEFTHESDEYVFKILNFPEYNSSTYNNKSGYVYWKAVCLRSNKRLNIRDGDPVEIHFTETAFVKEYSKFGRQIKKELDNNERSKDCYIRFSRHHERDQGFRIHEMYLFLKDFGNEF